MSHCTPDVPCLKTCSKCKESKPATTEYFSPREGGKLRSHCKVCSAERTRAYREANPKLTMPQPAPDHPLFKTCTMCGETKPATTEYFARHQNGKYGLRAQCKQCRAAYNHAHRKANPDHQAEYYKANKERITQYGRAHYAANKERYAEYNRAWREAHKDYLAEYERARRETNKKRRAEYRRVYYQANKERLAEYGRAWYEANKERLAEHFRAYNRAWYQANKARAGTYWRIRRARKHNAEGTHTAVDIKKQYKAQKGKCYYCKCKVGKDYHVDHVIPLSRGGSDGPENLVIACATCNLSKNNRLPHEWAQGNRLI